MNSMEVPEEGVSRQTVKCEVHDLHYNPAEQTGCVLCLREERRGEASLRYRLALVVVLGGAFLVTVFHQATRSGEGGSDLLASNGDQSDSKVDPNRVPGAQLNPELYKAEIEAVENVIYQRSPAQPADLERAAGAARALAERVQSGEDPLRAGQAVIRLLAWVSNSLDRDVGYAAADLSQARAGWEEVRREVFRPATWFGAADAPLESGQQPVAEAVDQSVVASLRLVGNDVYHLVRVGRLESDAIGEILSDANNDPETVRIRQRWSEWRRDWARQVQRAAKRMPPPPAMTSNINLLVAYQKMVSALSNLSLVPVSGGDEPVPYLYQRRSRFEAAEREAEEAETRLKSLSR